MQRPEYYVGIDVASATFTSAAGALVDQRWRITVKPSRFDNHYDSFAQYLHWLQRHQLLPTNTVICMEATGVYNELLAHFLVANGYRLAIQPPLAVKRAFAPVGHKSDPVDSAQVSEYAYRFFDQLSFWQPRAEILEQIKVLLTVREQFVAQVTAHTNALQALQRKKVRTPLAEQAHTEAKVYLRQQIQALEDEIRRLIDQDPAYKQFIALLLTIPGVGLLLASHLLVVFETALRPPTAKQLAAYVGYCPYERTSGTSIRAPSTSRHYGPPGLRKLLYLAALSLRTHNAHFRQYFERKVAEGKPKRLVLNNIANKLLKIICAVQRSSTPFIPNYHSVHPQGLSSALTKS
jgi:transposase